MTEAPAGGQFGDRTLIILQAESVSLDDAGMHGYTAAEGVDPCGDRVLLLVCDGLLDDERYPFAPASGVAHEQTGILPIEFAKRITIAQRRHRCGRPTESGRPCRIFVAHPGGACHWHTDTNE